VAFFVFYHFAKILFISETYSIEMKHIFFLMLPLRQVCTHFEKMTILTHLGLTKCHLSAIVPGTHREVYPVGSTAASLYQQLVEILAALVRNIEE